MNFKGQNVPAKFVTTTGNRAWHTIHTNIGEECKFDLQLALDRAGENYQTEVTQLVCPYTGNPLPDQFGIFRGDTKDFYGVCGSRYMPVSNYDSLKPIMDIMSGDPKNPIGIESMGFWKTGHVAANFKIMETETIPDDKTVHYMCAVYGHDGRTVISYLLSSIRIVCSNTAEAALKSADFVLKTKHTMNVGAKLNQYGLLIDNVKHEITDFNDRLKYLSSKTISTNDLNTILNNLYGEPKILKTGEIKNDYRQKVLEAFEKNDGDVFKGNRGKFINLYNAITEVRTHDKRVTIQGDYDKSKVEEIKASRRILDNLTDKTDNIIPKFFELVMPMVA